MYDIRIVAGVQKYNQEPVSADVQETADVIVKSMKRFINTKKDIIGTSDMIAIHKPDSMTLNN